MIRRKVASKQNPVVELQKDEDHYILTTTLPSKTMVVKFDLSEEIEEDAFNGGTFKSTFQFDGNTLSQTLKRILPSYITREFTESECIMTVKRGNLTAKRWYKIVE